MAAVVVAALVVSIVAGGALWYAQQRSPASGDTAAAQGDPLAAVIGQVEQAIVPAPESLFGKDRLRLLVVGLDYDYDRLDQETSKSSRSDIIMALNLDFKNHRLYELSIPRDMLATMPDGRKVKINEAQSEGGVAESKAVIADWLGIPPFDRYVVMRIDTSKDVINAIGGIDVNVENSDALKQTGKNGPIDYDDSWGHLHVHLKPGLQHLDGERAVGYARFRHDWCSDPCRIMRQQQIVRAIVERLERDKLNTLTHAQRLLAVVRKDIQTDLTSQEELSSAVAFSHVTTRDIHTAQVPYTAVVSLPAYGEAIVPDDSAKQKLVAQTFGDASGNVAEASPPPANGAVHPPAKRETSIAGNAAAANGSAAAASAAPSSSAAPPDAKNETSASGAVADANSAPSNSIVNAAPPNGTVSAAPSNGIVRLHVKNGTSVPGLAARVAAGLRRQGFNVSDIGNAATNDFATTEIHSGPKTEEVSNRVRKVLGDSASIVPPSPDAAEASDVTIVLGRDALRSIP
jgi:LCP family protein required for cell wall assembly